MALGSNGRGGTGTPTPSSSSLSLRQRARPTPWLSSCGATMLARFNGVAVRRSQFGTDWDGMSWTHVAPRDIQRLPLARVVRAALAAAATVEWAANPVSLRDLMPSESEPPDKHGMRSSPIPGQPAIAYDPGERGTAIQCRRTWNGRTPRERFSFRAGGRSAEKRPPSIGRSRTRIASSRSRVRVLHP